MKKLANKKPKEEPYPFPKVPPYEGPRSKEEPEWTEDEEEEFERIGRQE